MSESFETRQIGKLFNLNFILNCNMYLKVRTLALYKVFVTVVGFFLWFIWCTCTCIACTYCVLIFIVHNNYDLKVVARHCWWIYFTMKFPWKRSREFTFIHSCWMFTQVCFFYSSDNTTNTCNHKKMMTLRLVIVVFVVGVKAVNNQSFIRQRRTEICPHLSRP